MKKLTLGLLLALFASAGYAAWSILSDIVVSLNKVNYFDYLIIFEASLVFFELCSFFLFKKYRSFGKRKSTNKLISNSILAGFFFGIGTIIFYGLIGNQNYPFVASASYVSVVPFVFFLAYAKKQKPATMAILGTIIVFIGLVSEVVALYGSDFSTAVPTILLTALMSFFWILGYYFLLISMVFRGYNVLKADLISGGFELITVLGYGIFTNSFVDILRLTPLEVFLSIAVAVFLMAGGLSEEFSLRLVEKFKQKYLDVWNVFVSLEIVGIALFSIFFLTLYYTFLIVGLVLTILGTILIAAS